MLNTFLNWINQTFLGSKPKTNKGEQVRYKFNRPGLRNFHLLPQKNRKQFLNTFKPYWQKANDMTKVQRKES